MERLRGLITPKTFHIPPITGRLAYDEKGQVHDVKRRECGGAGRIQLVDHVPLKPRVLFEETGGLGRWTSRFAQAWPHVVLSSFRVFFAGSRGDKDQIAVWMQSTGFVSYGMAWGGRTALSAHLGKVA